MGRALFRGMLLGLALILGACATWLGAEAPKVTVASIEEVTGGEGLELRMLMKLRVANPNDFPIAYDGLAVKLDVQGRTVATGVSDEKGEVPRFGESLVGVRVTISLVDLARQALRGFDGRDLTGPLTYRLEGKLHSPTFGATPFRSEGELRLPL